VSLKKNRLTAIGAPLAGLLLGALIMWPLLDRNLSPVTSGMMIGVAGVLCILGVAFGIWNVRRAEARRKAKEQIWLKH
jgi:F0F1-type ATP synthase assembly protein I